MKMRDVFHVAVYEAKPQSRGWGFLLFVFGTLFSITLYQLFLQGEGYCENWKLVALPSSVPLINAYLFSVLQSLFVIVIMTDFPRREGMGETLEPIYARPMGNADYTWGRILGNVMLFSIVNVIVMLACIFFVNLNSLAPLNPWYYLFYFFTLNIPSLIFMMGLSLWSVRVMRFRYLALLLLLGWLGVSIVWLPYVLHGTVDFLATGVPNLFSDVTGHLGLGYYLLHRSIFLLLGTGFVFCSIKGMKRLPSVKKRATFYAYGGGTLILLGIACGILLEAAYWSDRSTREKYRESFRNHWKGKLCHIERHSIRMEQRQDRLFMESDLILCNLTEEKIDRPLLFLNPGLRVEDVEERGKNVNFKRDGQIIILDRPIDGGDSLRLRVCYSGKIDESFTNLQLSDQDYENPFYNDLFFPTGRRSAFIGDDYLLLTPACGWYPTAIAPVHPFMPMNTGKDMTLYYLKVVAPRQASLFSQGRVSERGDTLVFISSGYLPGISVCGGNFKTRQLDVDSLVRLSLNTITEPKAFFKHFAAAKVEDVKLFFYENPYMFPDGLNFADLTWKDGATARLSLIETPLSFRIESNEGRVLGGQIEPGIFFLPERSYTVDMFDILNKPVGDGSPIPINIGDGQVYMQEAQNPTLEQGINLWYCLSKDWTPGSNSHPLLMQNSYASNAVKLNPSDISSLMTDRRLSIYSEQYPFINILWDRFYLDKSFLMGRGGKIGVGDMETARDYIREHSLKEAMLDENIAQTTRYNVMLWSLRDLVDHIGLKVSVDTFFRAIDDIYHTRRGMIRFEDFCEELKSRTGGDVGRVFERWLNVRHNQYFKIKDLTSYFYPDPISGKFVTGSGWAELEGKVKNCGKEGGFVVVCIKNEEAIQRYSCYLNPGEAKSFYMAYCAKWGPNAEVTTGMSSNRPNTFMVWKRGTREKPEKLETRVSWTDIDPAVFASDPRETMVDNMDSGFSFDDKVNQTILQKWFGIKKREESTHLNRESESIRLWKSFIGPNFQGDSVRSCYYKSFGSGSCTATWKARLKEKGKYRVMVKAGYIPFDRYVKRVDKNYLSDVVLYYTVKSEGIEEHIEIEGNDAEIHSVWTSLGEFDFPEGEVSVTLSDKDEKGRKDLAIVADAVKWIKID